MENLDRDNLLMELSVWKGRCLQASRINQAAKKEDFVLVPSDEFLALLEQLLNFIKATS